MTSLDSSLAFDVIGDVHGYADKLVGLLETMGYRQNDGVFRHPSRRAVFVGDLIDRKVAFGPTDQTDVVRIARSMVEAGSALMVMGNHEFNAISWVTPNPDKPGDFLRTHQGEKGDGHLKQHRQFLAEVEEGSNTHIEIIDWFRTLPLWLDIGPVRFVHACWHPHSMNVLRPMLEPGDRLSPDVLRLGNTKGTDVYEAVEVLLKGPEASLPEKAWYLDGNGIQRKKGRIKWWDRRAGTLDHAVLIDASMKTLDGLPHPGLPPEPTNVADPFRYHDDIPVFFGHYWGQHPVNISSDNALCTDYSAGKGNPLVAYRWSGEPLDVANFVMFPG